MMTLLRMRYGADEVEAETSEKMEEKKK